MVCRGCSSRSSPRGRQPGRRPVLPRAERRLHVRALVRHRMDGTSVGQTVPPSTQGSRQSPPGSRGPAG
eukprot:11164718-Lingulodinium_polyedra.AAC.1